MQRSTSSVARVGKADEFGEPVELDAGTRTVTITNPGKVMFPSVGPRREPRTKLDLARYHLAVGDALMRTVRDRPVLLERYPNGVRQPSFFQKRIPDSAPDWLATTTVATINGTTSQALVIADAAADLRDGAERAAESIDSGKAAEKIRALATLTTKAAAKAEE